MRGKGLSEYFKTLREPIIEQQKKTDEKQDKVIEQLQKNQKAFISGVQDIMTLNRELPQIPPEELEGAKELPVPKTEIIMADIDKKFGEKDRNILESYQLMLPSLLLKLNTEELNASGENVKEISKAIGSELSGLKRTKKKDVGQEIKDKEYEKKIIDAYSQTITDVKHLQAYRTPQKGQGIRYKQPKRNAYKIQDGGYGGLAIDLPKLFDQMKLNVFRGGKLVYGANADQSLINLLTKRYNPKTKYSLNAVKIFNDLNTLSNMPKHQSSGKSRMVGSSVTYYNDPQNLMERMNILIGSIQAGNNSPVIKNDLSQINDELLRINAIDQSLRERFYQKYLK